MGWSGPGRQRHRRHACVWGTHAAAGHRCRGGLKAHAPSFGRPGFATGSSGSSDAAAHACGRRPGRGARVHAATRGRRYGSTPYASIADDSEVVRNRPIKCCDGFHSISHYLPAPAIRGDGAWRDGLAIREILTGGAVQTHVGGAGGAGMQLRSHPSHTRVAIHPVTQIGVRRSVHGCEPLRTDHEPPSDRNGATGQNADRTGVERGSNGTPRKSTLRERIPSREAV